MNPEQEKTQKYTDLLLAYIFTIFDCSVHSVSTHRTPEGKVARLKIYNADLLLSEGDLAVIKRLKAELPGTVKHIKLDTEILQALQKGGEK